MKKTSSVLLFCLAGFMATAQFTYKIKADSLKVTNDSCRAEFILENATKDINGFLYNTGNGRTVFRKGLIKLNDSTYVIGADTLKTAAGNNVWKISGNNGINPLNHFVGTIDSTDLVFRTKNTKRLSILGNGKILAGTGSDEGNYLFQVAGNTLAKRAITVADIPAYLSGNSVLSTNHYQLNGAGAVPNYLSAQSNIMYINGPGSVSGFQTGAGLNNLVLSNVNYSYTNNHIWYASKNQVNVISATANKLVNTRLESAFSSSSVTNYYDLLIEQPLGSGFPANHWSVYQENAAAKNYFAGKMLIGTTTDDGVNALQVHKGIYVDSSFTLGKSIIAADKQIKLDRAYTAPAIYVGGNVWQGTVLSANVSQMGFHNVPLIDFTGTNSYMSSAFINVDFVHSNAANLSMGVKAKMTRNTGSNAPIYGFYTDVSQQAGGSGHTYGLYSKVTNYGTGTAYALYADSGYAFIRQRVGIGTATPAYSLDVAGTTRIIASDPTALEINSGASITGNLAIFKALGNTNFVFTNSGTLYMPRTNLMAGGGTVGAIGDNPHIVAWDYTNSTYASSKYLVIESMYFAPTTRNVMIGTTVDAGFKFNVEGTARISSLPFLASRDTVLTYDPVSKQLKSTKLSSAYSLIKEDASDLSARTALNFGYGVKATDNSGSARTDVDVELSNAESFCSSDVTLTANTYSDAVSFSLAAGTWLISGTATVASPDNSSQQVTYKLWDGTTVYQAGEASGFAMGAGTKGYVSVPVSSIVVLTGTTTVKVSIASTVASVIKATPGDNNSGTTNKATSFRAVRIK